MDNRVISHRDLISGFKMESKNHAFGDERLLFINMQVFSSILKDNELESRLVSGSDQRELSRSFWTPSGVQSAAGDTFCAPSPSHTHTHTHTVPQERTITGDALSIMSVCRRVFNFKFLCNLTSMFRVQNTFLPVSIVINPISLTLLSTFSSFNS